MKNPILSRSDRLNLAVSFKARNTKKDIFVALATTEFGCNNSIVADATGTKYSIYRALKHTAKFIYVATRPSKDLITFQEIEMIGQTKNYGMTL